MKKMPLIVGILFLAAGLIGIAWARGKVFSQAPGATELSTLAGGVAIHAVRVALGAYLVGRYVAVRA